MHTSAAKNTSMRTHPDMYMQIFLIYCFWEGEFSAQCQVAPRTDKISESVGVPRANRFPCGKF